MAALSLLAAATATAVSSGIICEDHRGHGRAFRMLQPENMDRIMHGAGQDKDSFWDYWNFRCPTTPSRCCSCPTLA
jgi:hypothetical protein